MPNTRLGLWKSINKRRGKDVVSTASAASTVEESVSCGTFGSASKQTLLPGNHTPSTNEKCRADLSSQRSEAKIPGPVDEIIIQPLFCPLPNVVDEERSYQYSRTEDDHNRLNAHELVRSRDDYAGPVDVDAYIQEDLSTSTTSEERHEILAIKRRLQSKHASKIPRQIIVYDNDDHEISLSGYDEGFGTMFDDIYHNPFPFDEAARDKCTGYLPSRVHSRTASVFVKVQSSKEFNEEYPADEYYAVSRRNMAPNGFDC
ncbi:hypothetical protein FisN_2Lu182 [Fistulifera solaris]|uniref:Uncharacterized protein n=1 Tax=Fistulifera solaris TaxID=1519565 RepID=A0A1Z5KEZ4_FISSO|nr:hypothetical protein FisN_2Lu182 [Fistulifera solaris]|eukprot:GAX24884.1 hypothetical protein FisN_2Lu182 [Fistulifera solaris]